MVELANSRPVPDPTLLTTEQLLREIANLRAIFEGQLDTLRERLGGMDRATELLGFGINRVPSAVDTRVTALEDVIREQFRTVDQKFDDLQARTAEQKADTKAAVDAALQAAKEAVGQQTEASERSIAKSEAATTKQIDGVIARIDQSNVSTGESISDLKSRMDRMESGRLGVVQAVAERREETTFSRQGLGSFVGVVAVLVAFGSLVALALKP